MRALARWGHRTLWALLPAVAFTGCSIKTDVIGPHDRTGFALAVVDSVHQQVTDSTFRDFGSGEFIVTAPTTMSQADLARIATMDVVWPDGSRHTALKSEFTPDVGGLVAGALVPQETPLARGVYTLEVTFTDGRTASAVGVYDGVVIPPVAAMQVHVDESGVRVTWLAPGVGHTWVVALRSPEAGGDSLVVVGGTGVAAGGVQTVRVIHHMEVGIAHTLMVRMDNACSVRVLTDVVERK